MGRYGDPHFNDEVQGGRDVLGSRAKTGLSGMITVSAVLLAVQLITGVRAFPL
jgi:hypothetical protein